MGEKRRQRPTETAARRLGLDLGMTLIDAWRRRASEKPLTKTTSAKIGMRLRLTEEELRLDCVFPPPSKRCHSRRVKGLDRPIRSELTSLLK